MLQPATGSTGAPGSHACAAARGFSDVFKDGRPGRRSGVLAASRARSVEFIPPSLARHVSCDAGGRRNEFRTTSPNLQPAADPMSIVFVHRPVGFGQRLFLKGDLASSENCHKCQRTKQGGNRATNET